MKILIKSLLLWVIRGFDAVLGRTSTGRYLYDQIIRIAMGQTRKVVHKGSELTFAIPNAMNRFRANTFSSKEPETLLWIDAIPRGSIVWDIGANVGLYACYAARARGCRVFAFEPSVFNLELLARNIFLNELTELITIIPLPLSDKMAVSKLNMTSTEWGGALSTFGNSYGHDGAPLRKTFEFSTLGLSISDAINLLGVPPPQYMKIDVDGIEHLILEGGADYLRDVRSVLVEINDDFHRQTEDATRSLTAAGLILREKRNCGGGAGGPFGSTCNQIWVRTLD